MLGFVSVVFLAEHMNRHMQAAYDLFAVGNGSYGNPSAVEHRGLMGDMSLHLSGHRHRT